MGQGDHDGADGPERSEPASAVCSRVHRNVALSRWLLRLPHPDPARDRVRPRHSPRCFSPIAALPPFFIAIWPPGSKMVKMSERAKQRRIMVEESRRVGPGRSASACKYGYTCDGARTRACRPRSTRPFASSAAGEDPPPRTAATAAAATAAAGAAAGACCGARLRGTARGARAQALANVNVEPCFLSLFSPVLAFSPPYISLRSFVSPVSEAPAAAGFSVSAFFGEPGRGDRLRGWKF